MLHHKGKVGTHALLTQLLYKIYKRAQERERRRAQKWAQKQQEAHAGAATTREAQTTGAKQWLWQQGLLRAVAIYQQLLILPMPRPSGERAHPGSQSLTKETEGEGKKKAELPVTVTKTEHKAKQKWSCKISDQSQCPFLKPIIKSNYADVTLPPSCNDFLAAFNPACPATYCAVQWHTCSGYQRLQVIIRNSLVASPLPLFYIPYLIHGKKIYYSNLNSWMLMQPQTVLIWDQNNNN